MCTKASFSFAKVKIYMYKSLACSVILKCTLWKFATSVCCSYNYISYASRMQYCFIPMVWSVFIQYSLNMCLFSLNIFKLLTLLFCVVHVCIVSFPIYLGLIQFFRTSLMEYLSQGHHHRLQLSVKLDLNCLNLVRRSILKTSFHHIRINWKR